MKRGGFNEPYCSDTCYNDAGRKISSILLMGSSAQCGFCQKSLHVGMGSDVTLFPYRNMTLYICSKCKKKAKEFVQDIDECCMCGSAL